MRSVRIWTGPIPGLLLPLFVACTPLPSKDAPADSAGHDSRPDGDSDSGGGTDSSDSADGDGDGYTSTSAGGEDCDDTDPTRNPGATEQCDEVDNDCDGDVDEDALDATTWYPDTDADGYGGADGSITACDSLEGYKRWIKDCDDTDPTVHTLADELCDGKDNDCDGDVDEDDVVDAIAWHQDQDGDGYGDTETATTACTAPDDTYLENGEDCDDLNDGVYPGAPEICEDGVVNDCDADAGDAVDTCGLGGTVRLTGADLTLEGEEIYDPLGFSVSSAGDVDGDGDVDLLIGCYGASSEYTGGDDADTGTVYLLLGGGSLTGATDSLALDRADVQLHGEAYADGVGRSVSSAGDVDGDGLDDLLVGAETEDTAEVNAGAAYLLLAGGDLASLPDRFGLADADLKLTGESDFAHAGHSVSSAGDVDGDGLDDLLVGAPSESGGGDGYGTAYLLLAGGSLSGASGLLSLEEADLQLTGEEDAHQAGSSASSAGDVDGDGLPDVAIGTQCTSSREDCVEAAYLLLAGGSLDGATGLFGLEDADLRLTGEDVADAADAQVSRAGDVDGDGLDDLLVGARYDGASGYHAGSTYLLLAGGSLEGAAGALGLEDADLKLTGEDERDRAGEAVSSAGDFDGDGLADLLIGAPLEGEDASTGAAYLLLGGGSIGLATGVFGLEDADLKLTGDADKEQAGGSVSSAGDLDGDGLDDLLVGASAASTFGAAYIVHGRASLTGGY